MMDNTIQSKEQLKKLWTNIYNTEGKPDWSHILPYYDDDIYFCDSVQQIHGMSEFKAMTERLIARSNNLKMDVKNVAQNEHIIFLEWEMSLSFKKYPMVPQLHWAILVDNSMHCNIFFTKNENI